MLTTSLLRLTPPVSSQPSLRSGKRWHVVQGSSETDESLVVCFGEMLIDFVPTINGLALAEAPAFKKAPGGAPANVAVGIARLGGSSAFIGKPLADEFGYMLADILKENNVNNEGMRFDPGARTALAFVTLKKDGEREFMFYRNPSADMLLEESELDLDLIRKFNYGTVQSAHIAATKVAKDAGVLLSYDPNLRLPLWPSADGVAEKEALAYGYSRLSSEEEIVFLTNGEDPYDDNVVRKLYHENLKLLLVTEGPDGCRYYTKVIVSGKCERTLKVDPVDTKGAGDALMRSGYEMPLGLQMLCGAITATERGFHIQVCADDAKWLCTENCERIYLGLTEIRGKVIPLKGNNLNWSLLKCDENDTDVYELTKSYSKLMKALDVMHECFKPVKHTLSDKDMIEDVIFSRVTKRSNFEGFYTAVLEKNDEIITVVTLRIRGYKVAEIPFVATTFSYRANGMCRILMDEVERMIRGLGVEGIVFPASTDKVSTWTRSFGFSEMTDIERRDLVKCKFLEFLPKNV
ncbi:probable fructokinase-6, chloroplastic [Tanacetum coccineum]